MAINRIVIGAVIRLRTYQLWRPMSKIKSLYLVLKTTQPVKQPGYIEGPSGESQHGEEIEFPLEGMSLTQERRGGLPAG